MIKNLLSRPCPICSNNKAEILHTQKFIIPDGYPLPEFYDVVCCSRCGFTYADTPVTQKDYDLYYRDFSKYEDPNTATGSGISSWDRKRFQTIASEVGKFIPDKHSSIVDIGCANGGLLGELNRLGYLNLSGIDPSETCINYIKGKYNISRAIVGGLFSQSIIADKSLQKSFDCVVLSGVLEHIYNVQQAIKNVSNLLKNGGCLYIEVPDASHYDNYYVVPYYYFDSEHINHFDRFSLKNLLNMNGFEFLLYNEKGTPVSKFNIYPSVFVMGKKVDIKTSGFVLAPDYTAKNSIIAYIQKSKATEDSINNQIQPLVNCQRPIIIWGAGNYTMRLLKDSPLGKCNIIGFIDNDSKKWGKTIKGIPVSPPVKLEKLEGTIVICAALYGDDILAQIKTMDVNNKVILLK